MIIIPNISHVICYVYLFYILIKMNIVGVWTVASKEQEYKMIPASRIKDQDWWAFFTIPDMLMMKDNDQRLKGQITWVISICA